MYIGNNNNDDDHKNNNNNSNKDNKDKDNMLIVKFEKLYNSSNLIF